MEGGKGWLRFAYFLNEDWMSLKLSGNTQLPQLQANRKAIWYIIRESSWGSVSNLLDCDILVKQFELQSSYYVHFRTNTCRKRKDSFDLLPSFGLNNTTTVFLQGCIWHKITHEDYYAIKRKNDKKKERRINTKKEIMLHWCSH